MKTIIFVLTVVVTLSGCTPNMKITYKPKVRPAKQDLKFANLILDIEDFTDIRQEFPENAILYTKGIQYKIDGESTCINSEYYYRKESVQSQLSQLLVDHLRSTVDFKEIVRNRKDTADFVVKGSLARFYGQQSFSYGAAIGSQFGIVGALASAGAKSDGKIIFEISDLKICNRSNEVVKDLGTFRREYEGKFPASGDCWCIYGNVNNKLRDYFSELIEILEREIKSIK